MKTIHAVLHAHSTWSHDGHWPLARIARLYGALGVRAVMMTEHDTGFDPESFDAYRAACARASTRRCTLIPGIEYSSPDNAIHILTWGLDRFLAAGRPVDVTLRDVRAHGGVAILAHPVRRDAWRRFDPAWAPHLAGIELWNRKSDGVLWGARAWELLQETGLPPTVGQDFHRLRQLYPLTMRFRVDGARPLAPQLIAALAAGEGAPRAFWRPLVGEGGKPKRAPHAALEGLRRHLVRLRRGITGR